jgi:hypothetical protein
MCGLRSIAIVKTLIISILRLKRFGVVCTDQVYADSMESA